MSVYTKRVIDNISPPKSLSGLLPDAFSEWYFTENCIDHEVATEDCELCDQERLRYHFEIKNRNTDYRLWVGSSCILKFEVQVFERGVLLNALESKKKLNRLTRQMRLNSCIKALTELADKENNNILKNALKYYVRNGSLTPKFAFVVLWRLKENDIDHSPSFFKVTIQKRVHKENLADMEESRVHTIWQALSGAQRKTAVELGHSPPKTTAHDKSL